jgi:hypothetical protein
MAGGAEAPRWPHIPVGQQEPATPPPPKRTAPSLEAPSLTNSHTAPSLEAPFVNKPANFSVSCSPGARHAPRLRGVVCPCSLLSCVRRGALPAASEESWQNMPSQQDPPVCRASSFPPPDAGAVRGAGVVRFWVLLPGARRRAPPCRSRISVYCVFPGKPCPRGPGESALSNNLGLAQVLNFVGW